MLAFVDAFNAMGVTEFSFERYLGDLVGTPYPAQNWMIGLMANWIVGGLFGFLYAWMFEYVLKESGSKMGLLVALGHILVAAIAIFPFFNAIHEFTDTGLYPRFGILGSGISLATPVLLITAHLLYGATMGLFYGPVRADRVRLRDFEPGEQGMPGERGVITEVDDPEDKLAV